jgi:hypothetical protein
MNIASHAIAMKKGGTGYATTALNGLQRSLGVINEKRIKVVINGGGLDPVGLAKEVENMVSGICWRMIFTSSHIHARLTYGR